MQIYVDSLDGESITNEWNYSCVVTGPEGKGGGSVTNCSILSTGNVIVENGGLLMGNTVYEGGRLGIQAGSALNNVVSGGSLGVGLSGYAEGNIVTAKGSLTIGYATSAVSNFIQDSGQLYVGSGATVSDNIVVSGGVISVVEGGQADNNTISAGGSLEVRWGSAANNNVLSGGTFSIDEYGVLQGLTVQSGGSAYIGDTAVITGTIILEEGGYVAIHTSNRGTVTFTDPTMPLYLAKDSNSAINNMNSGLVIHGTGNITTVISGFSGTSADNSDRITLANVQQSDVKQVIYPDDDHVTFDLQDGSSITLNVIGVKDKGFTLSSDVNGALTYEVCFLTGTLISMTEGACAVEDIQVGDKVIAYNPQTLRKSQRKVIWVGKKTAHVKSVKFDDEAGYPVRILKDAISKNVPNKDLLVTAEHCLFFNGHFTPARMLVNGRSIFYDHSLTSYDYYHIETEQHSVIMADGMLTESYLDTGNRHVFSPQQKIVSLKGKNWNKDAAAPLIVERSVIEPLYRQIEERAYAMGCECNAEPIQITQDADLRLITDKGQVIRDTLSSQDGRVVFIIPARTKSVRIVSRIRRLSNIVGSFVDDRNYAGILIGDMHVSDSEGFKSFNIHTAFNSLEGWHAINNTSRWTKGDAYLPLDQLGDFDMPIYLSMNILDGGPYILEDHEEASQKQSA